jgi:hypothetical protein
MLRRCETVLFISSFSKHGRTTGNRLVEIEERRERQRGEERGERKR